MHRLIAIFLFCASAFAAPVFLDDQFELPSGFRIYRAAEKELTGGSYALRFDGQGRLLVGDGTALRRLIDKDGDGVFDSYEVIATGLGWRGPQGILVYGDNLYCVGGDGIQMYSGYTNGPLKHLGRIGEKFNTGGDHDGHTLLRGHDGYIYFMAGNGAGITNRTHITEATSPCLIEREASVFRISPDGKKWECIANGGRNPPNLGINYLGDFFSFDSDMEWHVGLPWYRPCRLNHWVIGGDQGWQEVGAYPPYYIDNLPGILDVGRGSPTWGVFYEHTQFPKKYENAYLCCDYLWKAESNDEYHTTGRLVSFFLERSGSRWKAKMETLARPKTGAKDANGRSIPFALVDIDVAPDGSIYLTEHNQGIWRIVYDPTKKKDFSAPTFNLSHNGPPSWVFSLPQPMAPWSIAFRDSFIRSEPKQIAKEIEMLINADGPIEFRLRAIHLLGEGVCRDALATKMKPLVDRITKDSHPEIRAQAAWLCGLIGNDDLQFIPKLLVDSDPFVRRRAAEVLTRPPNFKFIGDIETALNDSDRTVRYAGMVALSHLPTKSWLEKLSTSTNVQTRLRALAAANLRNERPSSRDSVSTIFDIIGKKMYWAGGSETRLDLLRVIELNVEDFRETRSVSDIASWILTDFPNRDPNVAWEQTSVLGLLKNSAAYPKLLAALMASPDPVGQFHIFQSLAVLNSGWTAESENRLVDWALKTQQGWFAEFSSKGVEFPMFLQTSLEEFASNHKKAVMAGGNRIQMDSLLGSVWLALIAEREPKRIFAMYREEKLESHRAKLLQTMARLPSAETAEFLRTELKSVQSPVLRKAAIGSLKAMPKSPENEAILREAVVSAKPERKDEEIHAAVVAASLEAGDAVRGRKVYERLQCNSCHGGGQTPGQEGRIFGPDLAGVTARLTRAELADAMVYPSKQVADRFKAMAVTLKDGRELTGFVTERAADHVTFVDAQTIHRLAPAEIVSMAPQEKSLMPDGLLRTLNDQEIAHLLKFLSVLGTK